MLLPLPGPNSDGSVAFSLLPWIALFAVFENIELDVNVAASSLTETLCCWGVPYSKGEERGGTEVLGAGGGIFFMSDDGSCLLALV